MAVVVKDAYCSACGQRHTLCLVGSDALYSSRIYEYDCPSTRRTVRLPTDDWGEAEKSCPPNAVMLREGKL
jgi:hypothetical protein